jgi:hypothetical protein
MAHWRLGNVLEREGHKSAALNELEVAIRIDPSLEEARMDLRRLR